MAFRTNKVPAIEERTVSGSSVSFHSNFALPIKACKVSFEATQSGSGDPSPSNPRAISGVSAIGLNANSTPVSVSLGEERFGGELDLLTGELTITHRHIETNENWTGWTYNVSINYILRSFSLYSSKRNSLVICDKIKSAPTTGEVVATQIASGRQGLFDGNLGIKFDPNEYSSLSQFAQAYGACDIVYELREPITIQLSANELSSIIGNNTFSTDTGTLEITFADLQEKTASGSVASFNTALAMPLASCNIAVNAWQEGSGDPSPDNVRAVHGFSEVNATRCGVNVWDEEWELGSLDYYGNPIPSTTAIRGKNYIKVNPSEPYYFAFSGIGKLYICCYTKEKKIIRYLPDGNGITNARSLITPSNCEYIRLDFGSSYGTTYRNDMSVNSPSTDTDYHAYTGNTYTIQLGQEVYGAEVDVVNGVAHVTHGIKIFNGSELTWSTYSSYNGFSIAISDMKSVLASLDGMCNRFKLITNVNQMGVRLGANNNVVYVTQITNNISGVTDTNTWKTWLSNNPVELVYPLAEPFDIQLTPTQIETLIGNNTIFADTGDVDLTYYDLDIAKRGSFREVFKLP